MNKTPYIIEFTGIGGVGKSSIVQMLCKNLDESNLTYDNLTTFNKKNISNYNLKLIFLSFKLAIDLRPKSIMSFVKILKINLIYLNFYYKMDKSKRLKVFDEGLIHKARAIQHQSKLSSLDLIIEKMEVYGVLPNVVIVVKASPETIYNRRQNRNRKGDKYSLNSIIHEYRTSDINLIIKRINLNINDKKKKINKICIENEDLNSLQSHVQYIRDNIDQNLDCTE